MFSRSYYLDANKHKHADASLRLRVVSWRPVPFQLSSTGRSGSSQVSPTLEYLPDLWLSIRIQSVIWYLKFTQCNLSMPGRRRQQGRIPCL